MRGNVIRTIGVAGSIRGSGVTHLSVALSNYAASGLGEKTAYLELGGHGEISHWKETNEWGYFTDLGVSYYPNFNKEQIPILLNQGYEKIIMDFGNEYVNFREEILRCDRKLFLLNINPWQEFAAREFIHTVQNAAWGKIKPIYAGVNLAESLKGRLEKEFHMRIEKIPIILNPRCISTKEFDIMEYILEDSAPKVKRKKPLIPVKRRI